MRRRVIPHRRAQAPGVTDHAIRVAITVVVVRRATHRILFVRRAVTVLVTTTARLSRRNHLIHTATEATPRARLHTVGAITHVLRRPRTRVTPLSRGVVRIQTARRVVAQIIRTQVAVTARGHRTPLVALTRGIARLRCNKL